MGCAALAFAPVITEWVARLLLPITVSHLGDQVKMETNYYCILFLTVLDSFLLSPIGTPE